MAGAYIQVDDSKVVDGLSALLRRIGNMESAFEDIGEHLLLSHDDRWLREEEPDGTPWEELSQLTKAIKEKNADKILVLDGYLQENLDYDAQRDSLEFGTPSDYGATHQFGAEKGQFGRNRRDTPIPWGDIPARPFLGVSDEDETKMLDIVGRYLSGS